ncbi:MAG: ATP-dependent Clp protease ATP-binding subunit [Candidatus Eisenbacteria bacterium]|uniref:ATP-dependent Clp protease ATP-binding subunit n=1 Tax=Eiseniibacteriota bacterium TaxID=2212470 RepID=A0A956SDB5_UNCEI|nr:ATP-dependent Clp protease ATP-binding subunit [Candidatus Eisenbacteria bacterium]MCB9462822.1 ATP-dependent Clp protease ATP-binding subunit [Candidatus Eisenbacteria bacterium]
MHDKFTERVRKVIFLAREEASRLQHDSIGTEHLLLGLLREGEGIAATVLSNLGLDLDQIRQAVESMVAQTGGTLTIGEIPFTSNAKRVLELSVEEARQLGHNYVGTEHLLLGLIREGEGVAAKVLADMGVDRKKVREETLKLLGGHPQQQQGAESEEKADTPSLNQFGRDLTQLAREGKLDPIFGREGEIERVVQILCRRKKNNPILIGEPGVGKTAIAEGLAQRIVEGKVPELLRNHRLITLDLASVVAGTKYRGQFEERLKNIMNEIRESQDTIIFIDELHTIVGAGGAEGAIDASNMLKPALARGELQCIGATTLDEYRKYIEKDGALERRFQTVMVDPPSLDTTIQILKGLRDKYEAHHRIHYSDQALVAAVKLSDRFITDRHLPDKAIDVIDEAGARARLSVSTLPNELRDLDAKIEKVASEKEASIRAQEFEKAASFRDKEKELRQEYYRLKKEWNETKSTRRIEVTDDDIAVVISSMTKIPVSRLEEKEQQKLVRMEEELGAHIIGQEEAVQAIARAVRRNRAGLRDPRRPIGTFVFLGPTGVGKTELARVIAKFLFDDPDSLIRIDMSEYMEKFSVSRLVGAPPGYVGYEEGGQLTEKVRRKPYSVVLLDEIEKAHPDVFNILLQVFEDGVLTDSLKRKVSFKNTVIIMTSNIGARQIRGKGKLGFSRPDAEIQYGAMKDTVMDEVKKVFNPEFLNRIDEIIVFRPLEKSHIEKIVEILLGQVRDRLAEQEMAMSITPGAMGVLIDQGYDPDLGARPLRRAIQKLIEDPLAEMVLKGRIKSGSEIRISKKGNEIAIDEKTSLEPAPEVTHQE